MAITKTDFMRGMQCRKMLWLDKHRPNLRVIPPEVQARLDAGNDFGDRAMSMFGPYEEMTVYLPGKQIPDKKAMIARPQEHLAKGTPVICEALSAITTTIAPLTSSAKRKPGTISMKSRIRRMCMSLSFGIRASSTISWPAAG